MISIARPDYKSFVLYLASSIAISTTLYRHLDYAAGGMRNLTWSVLSETFPALLLVLAAPLLFVSAFYSIRNPLLASRLAFTAAILGWIYYFVMSCVLLLAFSIAVLASPTGVAMFGVPIVLLILTTIHSYREKSGRELENRA